MKIKEVLELQKAINNRKIPCDMYRDHKYWSESKQEYQDFLDMDLIHVLRIAIKYGMSREPYYNEEYEGIFTLRVKQGET